MKCSNGCNGEYSPKLVFYTLKIKGDFYIIDDVPADVCDICGDTLIDIETMQHIESLVFDKSKEKSKALVLEYA